MRTQNNKRNRGISALSVALGEIAELCKSKCFEKECQELQDLLKSITEALYHMEDEDRVQIATDLVNILEYIKKIAYKNSKCRREAEKVERVLEDLRKISGSL